MRREREKASLIGRRSLLRPMDGNNNDGNPNRRQQRRRRHRHQQQPPQDFQPRNSPGLKLPTTTSTSCHRLSFTSGLSSSTEEGHGFSQLPFDVLTMIAASFTHPTLRSASLVCWSWRDALRPLREAMLFLRWGKPYKLGHGGVCANFHKALDSFLKGTVRGSTLAMVDAGLLDCEMGHKDKGIALYQKAACPGRPRHSVKIHNNGTYYHECEP